MCSVEFCRLPTLPCTPDVWLECSPAYVHATLERCDCILMCRKSGYAFGASVVRANEPIEACPGERAELAGENTELLSGKLS